MKWEELRLVFLCLEFLGFFWRHFCGYSSNVSLGNGVPDLEKVEKLVSDTKDPIVHDEIEKIRKEFTAAKQRFSNIPEALKQMPKMNPTGYSHYYYFLFTLGITYVYIIV